MVDGENVQLVKSIRIRDNFLNLVLTIDGDSTAAKVVAEEILAKRSDWKTLISTAENKIIFSMASAGGVQPKERTLGDGVECVNTVLDILQEKNRLKDSFTAQGECAYMALQWLHLKEEAYNTPLHMFKGFDHDMVYVKKLDP